jgi:hypothetical protein
MEKEFDINLEIYPEDKIAQAIEDFKEAWEIKLENNKIVVLWEDEQVIEEIFNEFMNYIISLINE